MDSVQTKIRDGKYTHVAFDWDGTLVDSSYNIQQSIFCAIKNVFSIDSSSVKDDIVRHLKLGFGAMDTLAKIMPVVDRDALDCARQEFIRNYVAGCGSRELVYESADTVLRAFREKGVRLFVCTNKLEATFKASFEFSELSWAFDKVYCGGIYGDKPKPAMGIALVKENSVANGSEVLMIGDTEIDRQFSRGCGFDYLHFDHILSSPSTLLKTLLS